MSIDGLQVLLCAAHLALRQACCIDTLNIDAIRGSLHARASLLPGWLWGSGTSHCLTQQRRARSMLALVQSCMCYWNKCTLCHSGCQPRGTHCTLGLARVLTGLEQDALFPPAWTACLPSHKRRCTCTLFDTRPQRSTLAMTRVLG